MRTSAALVTGIPPDHNTPASPTLRGLNVLESTLSRCRASDVRQPGYRAAKTRAGRRASIAQRITTSRCGTASPASMRKVPVGQLPARHRCHHRRRVATFFLRGPFGLERRPSGSIREYERQPTSRPPRSWARRLRSAHMATCSDIENRASAATRVAERHPNPGNRIDLSLAKRRTRVDNGNRDKRAP